MAGGLEGGRQEGGVRRWDGGGWRRWDGGVGGGGGRLSCSET